MFCLSISAISFFIRSTPLFLCSLEAVTNMIGFSLSSIVNGLKLYNSFSLGPVVSFDTMPFGFKNHLILSSINFRQAHMETAIEILANIAGNTSDTSAKLNYLKNLSTQQPANNNIIISGNGTTKQVSSNPSNNLKMNTPNKSDYIAKQIAKGGF